MILVALGFLIVSIIIPALGKKKKSAEDGFWYNFLVFMRPVFIFFIGFCATFVWVQIMSKYFGLAAPNFIAACQPENVTSLCNVTSTDYVIVNCTTAEKSWVPASSSFPSVITAMQAFDMFFFALYIYIPIKSKANKDVKMFGSQCIASIFTLATGCLTIYCNEASIVVVFTGFAYGVAGASWTMMCLLSVETFLKLEKKENLPRFWNDPLPDRIKSTIPRQTLDPLPSGHSAPPPPPYSGLETNNLPPPVSHPPPSPGNYPTVPPIEWD